MAGRFNIVFAGNMGKVQALGSVLDAANIVRSKCPHVQFIFIGSGVEVDYLKQKVRDLHLKNVQFLPHRPQSQIAGILSLADVLLVHLKDNPLFRITIPSKTQAYLAVGKPILMGVRGDAAGLVMEAGAGLLCEPENPQSIAEAVIKFQAMSKSQLDVMGDNGRRFYEQELSLTIVTRRFEKIFESVVK
jgi:glycosyltransferase involved in cell wall biosynthesis